MKVKVQGKPFPLHVNLNTDQNEEIFFFLNFNGSNPKIDQYDVKLQAGNIIIKDSMFPLGVRKPRNLRFLAYSQLRISVIANLRFSYPQKNSKVFGKGQLFTPAQELYIATKLGFTKMTRKGGAMSKLKIVSNMYKSKKKSKKSKSTRELQR